MSRCRSLHNAAMKLKEDIGIFAPVVWLLGFYVLGAIAIFSLWLFDVF